MAISVSKSADVIVVGAGVIGLALARELHRAGAGTITVLERGLPGKEASFAAAGMLAPQAEADAPDDLFRFCKASNELYPGFAGQLLEETGVDIEFDDAGTLYLAFSENDLHELSRRYEWQTLAGLRVEHLSGEETHKLEPFVSPDSLGSLYFPEDRQVENRRLLTALEAFCDQNGVRVATGAEVSGLITDRQSVTAVELMDGKRVEAGAVVLATGAWTRFIKGADLVARIPEIKPIRGQMLSFRTAKRLFTRVIYSPRGYLVPRKFGRILAGATTEDAGFDNRVTEEGITQVLENAVEISPSLANIRIEDRWSGLRPFAEGGRPVIGAVPGAGNLYVATAHYRNGILLAPLTAKLLAANITSGTHDEFLDDFSPERLARVNAV